MGLDSITVIILFVAQIFPNLACGNLLQSSLSVSLRLFHALPPNIHINLGALLCFLAQDILGFYLE